MMQTKEADEFLEGNKEQRPYSNRSQKLRPINTSTAMVFIQHSASSRAAKDRKSQLTTLGGRGW